MFVFNSRCPYHQRRCKCLVTPKGQLVSLRRTPLAGRQHGSQPVQGLGASQTQAPDPPLLPFERPTSLTAQAYMHALRSSFVNAYFPVTQSTSRQLQPMLDVWMSRLPPTLETLTHALRLLLLGTINNNRLLKAEGRQSLYEGTARLRRDLNNPSRNIDGILGATQHLLACEPYVATDSSSWMVHESGLEIAVNLGRRAPAANAALRAFLLRRLQRMRFTYALILRIPLRRLPTLPEEDIHSGTDLDRILRAAEQLPTLLHHIDTLKSQGAADGKTRDQLLKKLAETETALCKWLDAYHHRQGTCHVLTLIPTPESEAVPSSQDLPLAQLVFHALYWICQLLCKQARFDLAELSAPQPLDSNNTPPNLRHESLSAGNTYADHLCATISLLSHQPGGPIGRAITVSGLLHFTSAWYRCVGDMKNLQWCERKDGECRGQVPFLHWESLLPSTFFVLDWIC